MSCRFPVATSHESLFPPSTLSSRSEGLVLGLPGPSDRGLLLPPPAPRTPQSVPILTSRAHPVQVLHPGGRKWSSDSSPQTSPPLPSHMCHSSPRGPAIRGSRCLSSVLLFPFRRETSFKSKGRGRAEKQAISIRPSIPYFYQVTQRSPKDNS